MRIRVSAVTDVGRVRSGNEDAIAVCVDVERGDWLTDSHFDGGGNRVDPQVVAIVSDGLGGHNAGEYASAIVIDTFKRHLVPITESASESVRFHEQFSQMIAAADDRILADAVEHPDRRGMGATVVACWIAQNQAHVAWCGDSRCYHFSRHSGLRQITHDHSHVQQLVDNGSIEFEAARNHPESHVITRGCGDLDCACLPDFADELLQSGDMLLLCSDGLSVCCSDDDINRILHTHHGDPALCCKALLQASLSAGAPDNVSVIVMECRDDDITTLTSTGQGWHKLMQHIQSFFTRTNQS